MIVKRTVYLVLILCLVLIGWTGTIHAQRKVLTSLEQDITSLVESVKPSLVTIETASRFGDKKAKEIPPTFVGSGIIYTPDGYILTSASVVSGMRSFKITLPDDRVLPGKLVGTDDESNLAVLKVETTGLSPAKLGNSDSTRVGSWLTVVGNSYGLPNAVALGLVNGLREDGFIQMSANVSPGNSGGPVLDTYGRVIGLVAAKLSESSYIGAVQIYEDKKATITIPSHQIEIPSSGISLALPINKVKKTADEIIKYGSVKRGYLGIYPENLTPGLVIKPDISSGVLVAEVVQGSPAEKAGLLKGDIIVFFAETPVIDGNHIRKLIKSKKANEGVKLQVLRGADLKEIQVVLGEAKPTYSYNWWEDKEPLDFPETPSVESYYESAYDYLQQVRGQTGREKETIDKLRLELDRLSEEMKRMSEELEKLKQEKAKE